jgi:purine-cytosine permease-like protein
MCCYDEIVYAVNSYALSLVKLEIASQFVLPLLSSWVPPYVLVLIAYLLLLRSCNR